jgi:GNAT superfamily N-acetyltransferase
LSDVTTQRIDAVWAAFFGLSTPAFLRPGIQVVGHHELAGHHGVWLFRHHASLCVSVPPDLVAGIQAAVGIYTVDSLFSQAGIRALLGRRVEQVVGPAYQGYIEPPTFRPLTRPGVRALAPPSRVHLEQLAEACGVEAWEHAGIAFDEAHVFGCFADGRLVAAARFRPAWCKTAHIGVATHPDHRRRHYGSAVVSAASAQALEAGFIGLYQTLLENAPSVALATRLGYRAYASLLAVRLPSEAM